MFSREYGSGLIFEEGRKGEGGGREGKVVEKGMIPVCSAKVGCQINWSTVKRDRRARRENAEGKKCWQGVEGGKNGLRDIVEIRI